MARAGNRVNRRSTNANAEASISTQERRIATPNPDLLVVKIGKRYENVQVWPKERASGILARVAEVMRKPGADRGRIFNSTSGKRVYAYFVYSKDPTKVVREDELGHLTLGRFVGGRFRPISSARAD